MAEIIKNLEQICNLSCTLLIKCEVMTYISLNPSKSSVSDETPLKFIKMSEEIISPILVKLLNNSVSSETFPNCLKIGKLIPIHKKGD